MSTNWSTRTTMKTAAGQTYSTLYKYAYTTLTHADDPRIPAEEGWRVAVWPNGEALACHPNATPIGRHLLSLSTFESALDFLLELHADNQ